MTCRPLTLPVVPGRSLISSGVTITVSAIRSSVVRGRSSPRLALNSVNDGGAAVARRSSLVPSLMAARVHLGGVVRAQAGTHTPCTIDSPVIMGVPGLAPPLALPVRPRESGDPPFPAAILTLGPPPPRGRTEKN